MKKYIAFSLPVVGLLLATFGCNNNTPKNNKETSNTVSTDSITKKETTNLKENETQFKVWLRDTLRYLASDWEKNKGLGISLKNAKVDPDSLGLTIVLFYDIAINPKEKLEGEIGDMIETLKEYGELPKSDFKLRFQSQMYYYPSSIEEHNYDFLFELKSIEVVELKTKTEYFYLRGRLTGKEVTKTKKDGTEEKQNFDFIWKGDSLTKKAYKINN
jgi:hypothetical protein